MPYYALEIAPSALPLWLLDEHARADRCDPYKSGACSIGFPPEGNSIPRLITLAAILRWMQTRSQMAQESSLAPLRPPQRRWRVSRLPRDHHLVRVPKREVTLTLWYACSGDAPTTDGAWVQE